MPEVPSKSTATGPAAAPPPLDAPDRHPPTCRAVGAEPTHPFLLGRARKHRWLEGGTHRNASSVSAESELGTLPVSTFWLRMLHTRGGLGRSAVLRHTHSNHVPLSVPAQRSLRMGCPLSTP